MRNNEMAERVDLPVVASFGTTAPTALLLDATAAAKALAKVVEEQKLFNYIRDKKYVRVEGWMTLGAMLGVFPKVVRVTPLDGEIGGYEAEVEIRTLKGEIVSSGIASCGRDEKRWKTAEDYAVRSMAQTRATSKAMRLAASWVMALAGFEPTPAEEMPHDGEEREKSKKKPDKKPRDSAADKKFIDWLASLEPWTRKTVETCKPFVNLSLSQRRELLKEVKTSDEMTVDEIAIAACERATEMAK